MEHFKKQALASAPFTPTVWFRYVDDTFAIWNHGEEKLEEFRNHLNSIHPIIQFTMEKETEGQLPFLDVVVIRKTGLLLGHKVYRKPTHRDRYLHKHSNYHPRQKRGIIKTLVDRANGNCEAPFLSTELNHLNWALQANGYSKNETKKTTPN